jgi:hypothetical protein
MIFIYARKQQRPLLEVAQGLPIPTEVRASSRRAAKNTLMKPTVFGSDSTVRWSCRAGDYVLWVRYTSFWTASERQFEVPDFWAMKDGDWITITNRV